MRGLLVGLGVLAVVGLWASPGLGQPGQPAPPVEDETQQLLQLAAKVQPSEFPKMLMSMRQLGDMAAFKLGGSFTLSAAHRRVSWRHAYYEVVVDEPIVDGKVADRLLLDGDGPYTPVPAVICSPPESICDTSY